MGQFSGTDGVRIIWFTRENHAEALSIMTDASDLPQTFDHWLKWASEAVALIEREGGKVVRVEMDINKFKAYCVIRGLNFDREGRQLFAGDPANWPASSKH
jgi:hypothetical protein